VRHNLALRDRVAEKNFFTNTQKRA
jgi:hypothetical protein